MILAKLVIKRPVQASLGLKEPLRGVGRTKLTGSGPGQAPSRCPRPYGDLESDLVEPSQRCR